MLSFLQFITESDDFPHFTSAEHVKKHVEGKHPGVSLQFHDSGKHQPDHASLSMIDVPKEHQRKGIGSYAMRAINHYADHNNKTVTLSPEHRGHGQPSKSKLVDFYKSHGYKPNKGRHKDYRFSDSMIRTPASLKEDDDDYRSNFRPAIKGWMSPSGKPHLISQYHEHKDNHHPEYLKHHGGKQGDQVQDAQAKGFVRFGGNYSHVHGNHHFVHYDSKHPKGQETAIKALEYMKPHHDDPVTVSGSAGIYNREKGKRNATAMNQLGHSSQVTARQALELLHKGKSTTPPVDLRKHSAKLIGKEINHPVHGKGKIHHVFYDRAEMDGGHNVSRDLLRSHGYIK